MPHFGKYRGTVVNNVDPQQRGRVQVLVPSVLGESTLSWAMPCVPYAGPGVGFFFIPPVDARIWVEFEGGDPDYPIWVGGYWDQSADVPANPQVAENKVLKTDTATVTIADGPGSASVTVETQTGMKVTLDTQGIELDNGQGASVKLAGLKVSINGTALEVT